jgi:hypothetical protein
VSATPRSCWFQFSLKTLILFAAGVCLLSACVSTIRESVRRPGLLRVTGDNGVVAELYRWNFLCEQRVTLCCDMVWKGRRVMTREGVASVKCGYRRSASDFHFVELKNPRGIALVASEEFAVEQGGIEPILVVYLEEQGVVSSLRFRYDLEPDVLLAIRKQCGTSPP